MNKVIFGLLLLILTGCIPLKQCDNTGGKGYDNFSFEDGYGLLQIGPSNRKRTITLLTDKSYAISPKGKRYGIHSELDPYDQEKHDSLAPYVKDKITLIDSNGKLVRGKLGNGTWYFHFEFLTPKGKESRDFKIRYWMYYYNPIWSGPPV